MGQELRKAREAAGLTQARVAELLGCGQGKINKIESQLVAVGEADLAAMLRAYQVPEDTAERLRGLAAQLKARPIGSAPRTPAAFQRLTEVEADAIEIRSWHSERIPGPLQSEYYMMNQFQMDGKSADAVTHSMRLRRARRRIFTTENPPKVRAILSESSLRRMPGGRQPEVMFDQLKYLAQLCDDHRQFNLQILTFDAQIPFLERDFTLLGFAGDQPDFVYVEYLADARAISTAKAMSAAGEAWRQLHRAALSPADSRGFVERLMNDVRTKWDTVDNG